MKMIFEIIIAVIAACAIGLFLCIRAPVTHYITCEYCGKENYMGTDTNATFEKDHLKTYKCKYCRANLFPKTSVTMPYYLLREKGKDENV